MDSDPTRYGVIGFDQQNSPATLTEKPEDPESNYAVTGLYFLMKRHHK